MKLSPFSSSGGILALTATLLVAGQVSAFTNNPPFVPKVALPTTTRLNLYVEDDFASSRAGSIHQDVTSLEEYVKARGGNRVIRKVLIANNGMAATKSIISMRRWAYMELGDENAIEFIAMATPEDIRANAEFVRLADSFVQVPGGKFAFREVLFWIQWLLLTRFRSILR